MNNGETAPEIGGAATQLRHKIFFSADIVGSTAFKQPFDASDPDALRVSAARAKQWQDAIEAFYHTARSAFLGRWAHLCDEFQKNAPRARKAKKDKLRRLTFGPKPRFWKTVGDEILFWKEVDHELQLIPTFSAWLYALDQVRKEFGARDGTRGLDVKATIWSAEFPIRNRQTVASNDKDLITESEEHLVVSTQESLKRSILEDFYQEKIGIDSIVDFIGPGIDVGFRLSSLSSAKKMAVSIDVAYLLSTAGIWYDKTETSTPAALAVGNSNDKFEILINKFIQDNQKTIRDFFDEFLIIENAKHLDLAKNKKFMDQILLHFSGRSFLKGALGGIKYPFLWINVMDRNSLDYYTEKLYILSEERATLDWYQLYLYCRKFYEDRKRFINPPMISLEERWAFSFDLNRKQMYAPVLTASSNRA
ncbi:MAG: hypothetical protein JNL35_00615 [Sphingopyxis sp.]|nr:hypothetical protein [Sphingopyxis sp.]